MRKCFADLLLLFLICITLALRPQARREHFRYLPNRYYHVVYSDCLRVPVLDSRWRYITISHGEKNEKLSGG